MAIDWAAARLDYVTHHELTYADIAAKYHAAHSTIYNRACSEGWTAERKEASKNVVEKSKERIAYSRSEQLAACNQRHLALAQKLESAVNQRLQRAPELSENALRNLAVVSEAAQRISRLALGAATENIHTDPYAQMSDQELAAELERLGIEPTLQ